MASILTVQLPANVHEEEARLLLAVKLFEEGKASLGRSAQLAGLSRRDFIDELARLKIPVFNYSPEELLEEASGELAAEADGIDLH